MYRNIIAFVMILATAAGMVGAADAAAPGDLLYDFDRQIENIQRQLQRRPNNLVALNERIIEERLIEAGRLIQNGSVDEAISLIEENTLDETVFLGVDSASEVGSGTGVTDDANLYCSDSADTKPSLANLATALQVPYATLLTWYCAGFGTGDINLAFDISAASNIPVDILFDQAKEGYTWDEIAQAAGVGDKTNFDTPENTGGYCNADRSPKPNTQHPEGTTLANETGESYDTIMKWFCQGFGFGEIRLASSLSTYGNLGLDIDSIFSFRQAGMGWGEIMKTLAVSGKPANKPADETSSEKPNDNKPVKTEKPEKPTKP